MNTSLRKLLLFLAVSIGSFIFLFSASPVRAYCEQKFIACLGAHPRTCTVDRTGNVLSPPFLMGGGMVLCCDTQAECDAQTPFCYDGSQIAGIRSALGCLRTSNPASFVNQLVSWSVGLAGLLAFGLIVYAGFTMTTAQGDLKKVTQAKDTLTSALLGLVLIVAALAVLNFLGVTVLGLNLFGFAV